MGFEKPLVLRIVSGCIRGAVALAVLGAGVGLFVLLNATREEPPEPQETNEVPLVRTIEVRPVELPRRWQGYGTARAMRSSTIASEISAVVVERPERTEAGLAVEAGQVLFQLDDSDVGNAALRASGQIASLEAQLAQLDVSERRLEEQTDLSRNEVEAARRDLERAEEALANSAGTESELDARRTRVLQAERTLSSLLDQLETLPSQRARLEAELSALRADLAIAQENVARTRVTAPFSGQLQEVMVEAGERVAPGTPMARLVDLSRIEVPIRLPASAAGRVSVGDLVELSTDAADPASWEGRLARIAPEADPSTRTITAFVEIVQDERPVGMIPLLPGQFVEAVVLVDDGERRIALPRRTVNGDRVLVVRAGEDGLGVIESREVDVSFHADGLLPELVADERDWSIIGDGLAPGERVVVSGFAGLVPGRAVRLAGEAGAANGVDGADENEPIATDAVPVGG